MSLSTVLNVRVTPRAGRTTIAGWSDFALRASSRSRRSASRGGGQPSPDIASERASSTLLVKIAAAPVDGAANDALIALLAEALDLPKRGIQIVNGERSRNKCVAIEGLTIDEVVRRVSLRVAAG